MPKVITMRVMMKLNSSLSELFLVRYMRKPSTLMPMMSFMKSQDLLVSKLINSTSEPTEVNTTLTVMIMELLSNLHGRDTLSVLHQEAMEKT